MAYLCGHNSWHILNKDVSTFPNHIFQCFISATVRKFLLQSIVNLLCCGQLGSFCPVLSTMNLRWSFPLQGSFLCKGRLVTHLRDLMTSSNNLHVYENLPNSGRTSSSSLGSLLLMTSGQLHTQWFTLCLVSLKKYLWRFTDLRFKAAYLSRSLNRRFHNCCNLIWLKAKSKPF